MMNINDLTNGDILTVTIRPNNAESNLRDREWLQKLDDSVTLKATFSVIGGTTFTAIKTVKIDVDHVLDITGIKPITKSPNIYLSLTSVIITSVNGIKTKIDHHDFLYGKTTKVALIK